MENRLQFLRYIYPLICLTQVISATEFTFDLEANGEECFFETIKRNASCQFEFQVVSGTALDVDVTIESPTRRIIYQGQRKEMDQFNFNATEIGDYRICFNNQFSTFTGKSIFLLFETGKNNQLLKILEDHEHQMTFMETRAEDIHDYLEDVMNYQKQYRLQEGFGRRFAKELNERVLWWSVTQTFLIMIISITQVLVLRKFFDHEPKSGKSKVSLAHQIHVYG